MNTFRAFRATSLILICLFIFTTTIDDINADNTDARGSVYSPENRAHINLKEFKSIHIPVHPDRAEEDMARMLQKRMESLYKITLKLRTGPPDKEEASILLGREQALSSGIVTVEELNSVKFDGYVIKGTANRIVITGYAPQGTIYGAYAFLRRIGLKIYPWHYSPNDSVEVFTPFEGGLIGPFSITSKPFFEFRDMLDHLDRGRFGGSILRYTLGDLRFAQNLVPFKNTGYLNWDHTAGYLVPLQQYYDDHPEYFSAPQGGRISKSTRNHNVTLCMCNPDVVKISTDRALKWMDIQKDRRYFAITDGDSVHPRCPQCETEDPIPDYYTDRLLRWVNTVAASVRPKHPDKILLTAAYQSTVKPPVETGLEPNVLIMYAPWYWTSRTTSAVSFAHPLNPVAMEEFMGWSILFPDQMGVYEYPGYWVDGTAERIKFYAKNKVRWLHFNAPRGNLLHWVNSQLLWDPLLDTEELESDFIQAFYGPAAGVMEKYSRILRETIDKNSWYSDKFFRESESLQKMRSLLYEAETIAEHSDLVTQTRIFEGVIEGLSTILKNIDPMHGDPESLKNDFVQFIKLNKRVLQNCERLHFPKTQLEARRKILRINLEELEIKLPDDAWKRDPGLEQEETTERLISQYVRLLAKLMPNTRMLTMQRSPANFAFNAPDEYKKWRFDSSLPDLVSAPIMVTVNQPVNEKQRGVKMSALLTRLPVLPRGNIKVHAGRFSAERTFDPPLDLGETLFLDLHLYASRDVPVTIYINKNVKLRSDVNLHAGEQIVRIDFRNYDASFLDSLKWDKKIRSIGFDVWPQDCFYPYPEAQDTEIVFFDMEATNRDPMPANLPHKGKAIWMTHFRANLPHNLAIFQDLFSSYRQLMMQDARYKFYLRDDFSSWKKEKFRTFTEHRIVSPVFAILTGKDSSANEGKTAFMLQKYLKQAYGVELPINPPGMVAGPYTGNAIILGKEAALATKRIHQQEFKHVGAEGFVIKARNGRIIISGEDDKGTLFGAVRFLEEHGLKFLIPGVREDIPDMSNGFLHELYLLDWPYFKNRNIQCGDLLMTQSNESLWKTSAAPNNNDISLARRTAASIKNNARSGAINIPRDVYSNVKKSPLSCYVAAKLLWNPFANLTDLLREFTGDVDIASTR